MRYIIRTLLALLLLGLLLFSSYYKSKSTAITLVGETLKYFPLTQSSITVEPFKRSQIVWRFRFSFPESYDEDIYVYTSMLGEVVRTNPIDLESKSRCFEKLDHHPYSKEGIEIARQRSKEGKGAQELCK